VRLGKAIHKLHSYLLHKIGVHLVVDKTVDLKDATIQATSIL
jgi:hypothetical protein